MRLRYAQLAAHLRQSLSPVYLLCGDEPLQLREATQALRSAARRAGLGERLVLEQDALFDWRRLTAATENLSLFSSRRLIELRITTPKLGRDGSAAVRDYCARPSQEDRLLILAPTLERKELKSAWAQAIDRVGVVLPVASLTGPALISWVEDRLRRAGFEPVPGVAALLAERAEGNLLAADQEVEKLGLIKAGGPLSEAELMAAIGDSARFDPFALSTAALTGDRQRVHRILAVLTTDGTAEALILWVLAREVRMLASLAFARARREDLGPVFAAHQVWESRRALAGAALARLTLDDLRQLLQQCAAADACIKGVGTGDPWPLLTGIADGLAQGSRQKGAPA